MTELAGAGGTVPDPRVETRDGPAAAGLRQAAARLLGVPEDELPPTAELLAALSAAGQPPPPLSQEERNAAAETLRAEAGRDHEAALAAADHTRRQGESLIAHAAEQAAKADEDRARTLGNADRIAAGEPAQGPPGQPAEPAGPPAGAEGSGE